MGLLLTSCCVFVVTCMLNRSWIGAIDLIFSERLAYGPMMLVPRRLLGDGRSLEWSSCNLVISEVLNCKNKLVSSGSSMSDRVNDFWGTRMILGFSLGQIISADRCGSLIFRGCVRSFRSW